MDTERLQTQNIQDIQGIDASTLFPDMTSQLTGMMAPFLIASLALSAVFAILYITSALRRRKVERAILDMKKILHEMNERDKDRYGPPKPPRPLPSKNETIASSEHSQETSPTNLS